jgi:hypothetical protein
MNSHANIAESVVIEPARRARVGIVIGDANGIGPEVVAKSWGSGLLHQVCRPVLIGSAAAMKHAVATLGMEVRVRAITDLAEAQADPKVMDIIDSGALDPSAITPGRDTAESGRAVGTWLMEADRLARAGLPLYAQHVDPIDTGTLVDIFRDDPQASLLGTDALRDGVDVPGHSLRLVVMEQAPWPKPSILHRARRATGGGSAHDDRIIRARLAQAFGRLIRSHRDHGHFVVLSAAFPSRLLTAFPEGTPIMRLTLEEALQRGAAGVSASSATKGAVIER